MLCICIITYTVHIRRFITHLAHHLLGFWDKRVVINLEYNWRFPPMLLGLIQLITVPLIISVLCTGSVEAGYLGQTSPLHGHSHYLKKLAKRNILPKQNNDGVATLHSCESLLCVPRNHWGMIFDYPLTVTTGVVL